ncbi:hypothetical protein FOZ62_013364, partial [Perkinsus olseni]
KFVSGSTESVVPELRPMLRFGTGSLSQQTFRESFEEQVQDGTGLIAVPPSHYTSSASRFHLDQLVASIEGLPEPEVPVRNKSMLALVEDPDIGLPNSANEGVSLGINHQWSLRVYNQVMADYKSVESNPVVTKKLISDEVVLESLRRLNDNEAMDPGRHFAKMALLEKKVSRLERNLLIG